MSVIAYISETLSRLGEYFFGKPEELILDNCPLGFNPSNAGKISVKEIEESIRVMMHINGIGEYGKPPNASQKHSLYRCFIHGHSEGKGRNPFKKSRHKADEQRRKNVYQ